MKKMMFLIGLSLAGLFVTQSLKAESKKEKVCKFFADLGAFKAEVDTMGLTPECQKILEKSCSHKKMSDEEKKKEGGCIAAAVI